MKRPKKKRPIMHLDSFGCVNELRCEGRLSARVQMNKLEIERLMDALERVVLRNHRIPSTKALAAVDTLRKYFSLFSSTQVIMTADMVISSAQGVCLDPILQDGSTVRELMSGKRQ